MLNLVIVSAFFLIVFFPITIKLEFIYFSEDKENRNKAYFSIVAYKIFRFFSGYITAEEKCVAIHLSNKKAKLIYASDLLETKNKYKKLKNFEIYCLKNFVEVGQNLTDGQLKLVLFIKSVIFPLGIYYKNKKHFACFKNDLIINEQTDGVNVFAVVKVAFNVFTLFVALIKKILEKIYAKKQSNRRSYSKSN